MVSSLEEAYELNQKKLNRIIGGNLWLRLSNPNIGKAIDLSNLGLNRIEETADEFQIGAMVTLRQLELNTGINTAFQNIFRDAVKDIVGTQFRNSATVGGSIWGRFGFSDVLTAFLAVDTEVELFHAGRVALADFVNMKQDNDILVRVIVKKSGRTCSYQALRIASTDFPILACCVSKKGTEWNFSIGARPAKAVLHTGTPDDLQSIIDNTVFGTNSRASKEYRTAMADVLLKRAIAAIENQGVE